MKHPKLSWNLFVHSCNILYMYVYNISERFYMSNPYNCSITVLFCIYWGPYVRDVFLRLIYYPQQIKTLLLLLLLLYWEWIFTPNLSLTNIWCKICHKNENLFITQNSFQNQNVKIMIYVHVLKEKWPAKCIAKTQNQNFLSQVYCVPSKT